MFCQGITALCVAAGTGSLPIVSALVGGGADVNGSSIGDAAVTSLPSQDELRSSLESWHAMAVTPLQAAAANGHTPVMQYLCTKGANVCGSSPLNLGLTPLHFACLAGREDAALLLIELGTSTGSTSTSASTMLSITDDLKRTPIALAPPPLRQRLQDLAATGGNAFAPLVDSRPSVTSSGTDGDEREEADRAVAQRALLRQMSNTAATTRRSVSPDRLRGALLDSPPPSAGPPDVDTPEVDSRPTRRQKSLGPLAADSSKPSTQQSSTALGPLPTISRQPLVSGEGSDDDDGKALRPSRSKKQLLPTSARSDASDVAAAGVPGGSPKVQQIVLPASIAKAFGPEVFQKFSSTNWKEREEALMQADVVLSSPHLMHPDGALVFEAGCELLCAACEDKVAQIFYAAIPVVHTLFSGKSGVKVPLDGQDEYARTVISARMPDRDGSSAPATSRGLQLMPELEKLLQSLIAKTSNANDRTADMASQTLVHVACHSSIGPRCICQVLLEYSPADQAGWRPLVGRIGVLQAVLGEFGVGTRSGLTIDAVTRVIRDAFSNPSVKARHRGTDLAMCLVPYIIGSHESNLSESDGVSLVSAYVTSKFSDCKPLLQKALLSKMSDAVRKFLGLSDLAPTKPVVKKAERSGRGTPRPGDDVEHKRMFGSNPSSDTGPAVTSPKASPPRTKVGAAGGNSDDEGDDTTDVGAGKLAGTTGSWLDVDLSKEDCDIAYAEPLSTELVSAAYVLAMTGWMGVDAARAAFSHDWRARRSALMACCKKLSEPSPHIDSDVVVASSALLFKTLHETVLSIYLPAACLVWKIVQAATLDSTIHRQVSIDVTNIIPLIVAKLGDTKVKVRATSLDLLHRLTQVSFIGVRPVLSALLAPESISSRRDNAPHMSAVLTTLQWLSKTYGMTTLRLAELPPSNPCVPVRDALDVASLALQHRDKVARRAGLKMFQCATASTTAGSLDDRLVVVGQVMSGMPGALRAKLTKKLSELAEARQNQVNKKAGFKGLDTIAVGASSKTGAGQRELSPWGAEEPDPADEVATASGKLPDAPPLEDFVAEDRASLIAVIGQKAVRCLYSKVWSHRQAAISLATRRIMKSFGGPANTLSLEDPEATAVRGVTKLNISAVAREEEAELDIPIIPGASAKVFMQLSSMIEHGLSDSVAAVYLASLELLMALVQHYLPTVSGKQLIVRAGLQPAIRAIVTRLGDTKPRVRETSEVTLISLTEVPNLSASMVFEVLIDDISGDASNTGPTPTAVIGRLKVLQSMIQAFGATTSGMVTSPSGHGAEFALDVTELMPHFHSLLESRHVPIRTEALGLYVSVYESILSLFGVAGANVMNGFITGLRQAQRGIIAAAVADFNRSAGISIPILNGDGAAGTPMSSSLSASRSGMLPTASQLAAAAPLTTGYSLLGDKDSVDAIRVVIGIDLAHKLSSDDWAERQMGMWGLASALLAKKLPVSAAKASHPLWEVILTIAKAGLLDPSSHVNVAVFDVIAAVTPNIDTVAGSSPPAGNVVPWDLWDVQLPFTSLVKTVLGKLADTRARVSDVNRRIIVHTVEHDPMLQ